MTAALFSLDDLQPIERPQVRQEERLEASPIGFVKGRSRLSLERTYHL